MQGLRPLSEAECYLRCYGQRGGEDTVRIVKPAAAEVVRPSLVGDRIRQLFETALQSGEPEAA